MQQSDEMNLQLEKRTHGIDTFRYVGDGIVQPLMDSVVMLIAIRVFQVGDGLKGLIAAANFIGFLLAAPLTASLARTMIARSRILSLLTGIAAVSALVAASTQSAILYAVAATITIASMSTRQPFFTDLYREIYHPDRRARLLSLGLRLQVGAALVFGFLYGWLLDTELGLWRVVLVLAGITLLACAAAISRLPGAKPVPRKSHWLEAVTLPFRNLTFGYVSLSWMLIGFANLWTLPLRVVYLTETQRGLGLSPFTITLILVVLPSLAKILVNPIWVRVYEKLSFPVMRIAINMFFFTAIPLFFLTGNVLVISFASFLFGMGTAGSPIIWQLWVTRIAPPEETQVYQASHAFYAGVRGVIGPFVGLVALGTMSFRQISLISALLVFSGTAMLFPLLRHNRRF